MGIYLHSRVLEKDKNLELHSQYSLKRDTHANSLQLEFEVVW